MSPEIVLFLIFAAAVGAIVAYRLLERRKYLNYRLRAFFKTDPLTLQIVSRRFATLDLPNIQLAVGTVIEENRWESKAIGYTSTFSALHNDIRSLIGGSSFIDRTKIGPVQFREVDVDTDQTMRCIENGIHLITGNVKYALHVRFDQMQGTTEVEILARDSADAESLMDQLRSAIARKNVYRGKVISLEAQEARPGASRCVSVRFHRAPNISKSQIILPENVLNLIERNTFGFYRHAEMLRQSGRSTKRGLLFYGRPGTGKTFTAKWLAHAYPDLTVMLLSGEQLYLIKECCQLARMLSPSLVIMEDVDLVATHRDQNKDPSSHVTLHQILNEMDGMPDNTDLMFLLTTNRADVLEPALAARPGRIDQAVEFPLPDAECRRRLLELYGRGLGLESADLEPIVQRTEGASPAFIQELMRKSALIAAEQAPVGAKIQVSEKDLLDAMRELLFDGGDLTRNLLGFTVERNQLS